MIRKLRIRLVAAAILSLLAVLTAVFGTVAVVNYRRIVSEADQKLQVLQENKGRFPENNSRDIRGFSPEMPYESRYFSVVFTADHRILSVNTDRIASVDSDLAEEYARRVLSSGKSRGFTDAYRFLKAADRTEGGRICFLSCQRELASFRKFLFSGILVSLAGSCAVLLLLIAVSERIVRPVSEAYEKQKRFITDAGHELKTPLTIISADADVLEMDLGENEWLKDIHVQTERLAELTGSLVYLARMEEQPQAEYTEFSITGAVQEAAADFQAVAKAAGRQLEFSAEPGLIMRGDEKAVRRLIAIFLDNAVKYSNEGGSIRMTLDRWKGQLRLQVYNTADHIEKETLPHLFDRFYRADQSRNSKTGGYGLGLSIAAAVTAAHRGKITAASEDEQSLLITVTFPG